MQIVSYTDYIVERLEIVSVITIFATGFTYFNLGLLAACLPCAVFHLGAYLGYRRYLATLATVTPTRK